MKKIIESIEPDMIVKSECNASYYSYGPNQNGPVLPYTISFEASGDYSVHIDDNKATVKKVIGGDAK